MSVTSSLLLKIINEEKAKQDYISAAIFVKIGIFRNILKETKILMTIEQEGKSSLRQQIMNVKTAVK